MAALKEGAFDYITKPLNLNELDIVSHRAIKIKNLEKNYKSLQEKIKNNEEAGSIIGNSSSIRRLKELINKVSMSNSNILITGESGSGKEIVARSIHNQSKRSQEKFIAINCSAIPSELLEAELFGYKKGSFTGATGDHTGLFEEANKGTLFLDEIGDMPPLLQAKVLRVLQEKEIKPIGVNKTKSINVRIISATHRNLKNSIQKGEFREDLFFRLCVIPIHVPPLRERREDIPLLASHFLKKYNRLNEKNISGFEPSAINKLKKVSWQGNVRELENTIERAVVLSNNKLITLDDLVIDNSYKVNQSPTEGFKKLVTLKELEREYIKYVSNKLDGRKEDIARVLGINRKTLYRKEKEIGTLHIGD